MESKQTSWSIMLCGQPWLVLVVPDDSALLFRDAAQASGVCAPQQFIIYVTDTGNPEYIRRVIHHEITHAVMYLTGQYDRKFTDEEVCEFVPVVHAQILANRSEIDKICRLSKPSESSTQ